MRPAIRSRACTLLTISVLFLGPVFAQRSGTSTAPTGGNNPPGGNTSPAPSRTPAPSQTPGTAQPTVPSQPIFLTGRVMLEDGTAPTSRVAIQRVCGTSQHTEAYTDSRGYFSFQLGSN